MTCPIIFSQPADILKSHSGMDLLDKEKNITINNSDYKQLTEEIINYFEKNIQTMFKKQRDFLENSKDAKVQEWL